MTEPASARLTLSRAMRLRHKGEFNQIRAEGRRVSKGCLTANWMALSEGTRPRLGVITTRKLGKAHWRSRARRLLRETFRLHQHDLREPVAIVLVARSSIRECTLSEVERDFLFVMRQAGLLKTCG